MSKVKNRFRLAGYRREVGMKKLDVLYRRAFPMAVYGIFYLLWFGILEEREKVGYLWIHMNLDDYIPFCEVFVVPYLLWFLYVPAVLLYLLVKDGDGYWKNAVFLATGMTVFLLISTFIPNMHHLRLHTFPRDNVFTRIIGILWRVDTPTNLFPSIHVFNSLAAHFAVLNNEKLGANKWVRRGSLTLCVSIILSTVLIKQHSVFDVLTAFLLSATMYVLVYHFDIVAAWQYRYRYLSEKRARKRAKLG